jgi:hypothetical protein
VAGRPFGIGYWEYRKNAEKWTHTATWSPREAAAGIHVPNHPVAHQLHVQVSSPRACAWRARTREIREKNKLISVLPLLPRLEIGTPHASYTYRSFLSSLAHSKATFAIESGVK